MPCKKRCVSIPKWPRRGGGSSARICELEPPPRPLQSSGSFAISLLIVAATSNTGQEGQIERRRPIAPDSEAADTRKSFFARKNSSRSG